MDDLSRSGAVAPVPSPLTSYNAYHIVGIGGIGISAIARMLSMEGKKVTGSDRSRSSVTDELEAAGISISFEQDAAALPADAECVIHTIAMPTDAPELVAARERGLRVMTYPEALGEISRDKFTIAISGTHGKTTTTAMIAKVLMDAGLDPTVIVGSVLIDAKSNFIAGKSSILVVEACEYRRSFLNLNPDVVVITNVEADHLDYYKDLEDVRSAFVSFVEKVPVEGFVVANMCQEGMADVVGTTLADVRDYSEFECDVDLKAPGRHNYENAKAALAVADLLHVDPAAALKSVSEFAGTWRRFESRGSFVVEGQGVSAALVYDDYAHHPTEVRATLAGAKERFQGVKKVVVFQPHTYTRTKALLEDFGEAFKDADRVIVLPIYAAREPHDETISSSMVADKITASGVLAEAVENHEVAVERVRAIVAELAGYGEGCVVFTMGAGDVRDVGDSLLS